MKTLATESPRLSTADPRQNLKRIRQTKADVNSQIERLDQVIKEGEEKALLIEAEQIYHDIADDERSETLTVTLADQREQRRTLQSKLKALELAEKQAEQAVRDADRAAQVQAAQRLLDQIRQNVRKLDGILSQAEQVNDLLIQLDAEVKAEGLAEIGPKILLLLSRGGAHWSALDVRHMGQTTTLLGWRQHVRGLLEVE
jgi:hypothetical protein